MPQSRTDREPVDEFHFTPPPRDAQLPTACELLQRCPEGTQRASITWPLDKPIFWFLKLVRSTTSTLNITDLSLEPLVFCQPDWYAKNFMVDDRSQAVAIDFADASFVPSSFVTYLLSQHHNRLREDVDGKFWIPPPEGTRNATALRFLSGRTMARSYDFYHRGKGVGTRS
ncbi:hypothetical protein PG990_014749 [Apiospora arundinis]|uniref:Protein kinase-like domain protein n=1 Tax=Apiospora arundinis TaxID=335852 RepID=A0ABR2HKS2_9PEZI